VDVDLESHACGQARGPAQTGHGAGVATLPWIREFRLASFGPVSGHHDSMLTGSLGNVRSLVVDTRSACLSSGTLDYDVMTDGPATIRLTDGRVLRLTKAGRQPGSVPAP
jgi:hypothetical protein